MAVYPFELLFDAPRVRPLPHPGRAHIALSCYSTENDHICLSCECRTVAEVEHEVKRLKKDLDRVLAQARRNFERARIVHEKQLARDR